MPARLFDAAGPRASELPAAPSAAPARPASEHAGQCSRAIIPGDDPGDQQPPERRGLYPDPDAVAANARLAQIRRHSRPD